MRLAPDRLATIIGGRDCCALSSEMLYVVVVVVEHCRRLGASMDWGFPAMGKAVQTDVLHHRPRSCKCVGGGSHNYWLLGLYPPQ